MPSIEGQYIEDIKEKNKRKGYTNRTTNLVEFGCSRREAIPDSKVASVIVKAVICDMETVLDTNIRK